MAAAPDRLSEPTWNPVSGSLAKLLLAPEMLVDGQSNPEVAVVDHGSSGAACLLHRLPHDAAAHLGYATKVQAHSVQHDGRQTSHDTSLQHWRAVVDVGEEARESPILDFLHEQDGSLARRRAGKRPVGIPSFFNQPHSPESPGGLEPLVVRRLAEVYKRHVFDREQPLVERQEGEKEKVVTICPRWRRLWKVAMLLVEVNVHLDRRGACSARMYLLSTGDWGGVIYKPLLSKKRTRSIS